MNVKPAAQALPGREPNTVIELSPKASADFLENRDNSVAFGYRSRGVFKIAMADRSKTITALSHE
jgi:hypothetical protein